MYSGQSKKDFLVFEKIKYKAKVWCEGNLKKTKRNAKERLFSDLRRANIKQSDYRGCNIEIMSYSDTRTGNVTRLRGVIRTFGIRGVDERLTRDVMQELIIRNGWSLFISRNPKKESVLNIQVSPEKSSDKETNINSIRVMCNQVIDLIHIRLNEANKQTKQNEVQDVDGFQDNKSRIKQNFSELINQANDLLNEAKNIDKEFCEELVDDLSNMLFDFGYLNPISDK